MEQHSRSQIEQRELTSIQQSMQSALIKSASEALHTQRVVDNEASHTMDPSSSNTANFVSVSEHLQRQNQASFPPTEVRQFSELSVGRNPPLSSQQPPNQLLTTIHHQQPYQQHSHVEPSGSGANITTENKDITTSLNNAAAQQPLHFDQAVGYLNKIKVFLMLLNYTTTWHMFVFYGYTKTIIC